MIVDAVRSGYFQARFDHKHNTVHFGGQEVESDRVRGTIATMARRLTKALAMINPAPAGARHGSAGWCLGAGWLRFELLLPGRLASLPAAYHPAPDPWLAPAPPSPHTLTPLCCS